MSAIPPSCSPARSPTICSSGSSTGRCDRPTLAGASAEEHKRERHEAARSGNSPYDSEADWIDYDALGLSGPDDLGAIAVEAL